MTEHIKINDVAPRIQHLGNGVALAFAFPFLIFNGSEMEVWLDDQHATQGFTVTGAGASGGGAVTFAAPPADGVRVTLLRRLALERQSDFQTDGIIRAKVLNDELDYQTAAIQQVADDVSRAVKQSARSGAIADLTLPEPAAGRGIKWSADGMALVNSDQDPDQLVVQAQVMLTASQQAQVAAEIGAVTASAQAGAAAASAVDAVDAASAAEVSAQAAASSAAEAATSAQSANGGLRISVGDTAPGLLLSKLVAGAGVTLTLNNPGGNETLTLAVTANSIMAYGGTVTSAMVGGQTFRIHTFLASGTLTVDRAGTVQALIVAGGGGGGGYGGGGGGGGGVISTVMTLATGNHTVTVGAGGAMGANGGNSVFNGQTAIGGGHGSVGGGRTDWAATSGGSGGGGSDTNVSFHPGGAGTVGQGNAGGTRQTNGPGAGGGGAGGVGANSSNYNGGNGGTGIQNTISGTSTYYAGGGGGACGSASTAGIGGQGGGGNGGTLNAANGQTVTPAANGGQNTGGGGGGGSINVGAQDFTGTSGGSGIVIIAYAL